MSLHVAMVVARFPPAVGGSELQAFRLARELASRGLRVSVLTQHLARETPAQEILEGIHVYRLALLTSGSRWESLAFIASAVKKLRTLSPDVTHAHMLSSPAVASAVARQLWGIPAIAKGTGVQAIGEAGMARKSFLRRVKLAYLKQNLDAVVCTVSLMREEFLAWGFRSQQIRMIPNGVDLMRFRPANPIARIDGRHRLGLPISSMIVLYTGRVSPEKGVDVLLEAWRTRKNSSEALLLILGDGPDRKRLQDRGVSHVQWLGTLPEVEAYLAVADLFVLPSRGEALSNSLLEAMASGLACIATRVGGTPEVVDNGKDGLLVNPDDPGALRQALDALLDDQIQRERLGREARRTAEARFGLNVVTNHYLRLYEELAR